MSDGPEVFNGSVRAVGRPMAECAPREPFFRLSRRTKEAQLSLSLSIKASVARDVWHLALSCEADHDKRFAKPVWAAMGVRGQLDLVVPGVAGTS